MRYLKVNLWHTEIGRLVWESSTRRIYFVFNPGINGDIPEIAPLLSSKANRKPMLPIYGDDRPMYQGLPPFIADSLPDSWGNLLFERWVKENRIPRNRITPLYKLMFIGTRGMGALEYEPCAEELTLPRTVDISSLYEMSLKVLEERDDIKLNVNDDLTLQALLSVGSSAGGRQMKAIVAIDRTTGEIRSGQSDGLVGFDYCILKFGDDSMSVAEIETTYHLMAKSAGIAMEDCRLFPVEGINHFITRRFDRKDGEKIHIQTLAAINPDARSYEDLLETCRLLSLSESEIEEIFRRMVFNVMTNNTDDHNKNFSFMLERNGDWRLAPAYDITFIFNTDGTGPNRNHRLSICGKTSEITKNDLLDFASQNHIENPTEIIDSITDAMSRFNEYAETCGISQPWRGIIRKTLDKNLREFGYVGNSEQAYGPQKDRYGREIERISIAINSKGQYDISAIIDGNRRRRFIKKGIPLYDELTRHDILNLPLADQIRLIEQLFPE